MNRFDPERHHRRTLRLRGYDYSRAGVYAITICTYNRECLFGDVVDGKMFLNDFDRIVLDEWNRIDLVHERIHLDVRVIMPNHFHGIIVLKQRKGAIRELPLPGDPRQRRRMTIPKLIGRFKMVTTKKVNDLRRTPGLKLWQRNYYERIVRDQREWNRLRQYIIHNPERWDTDAENPERIDIP